MHSLPIWARLLFSNYFEDSDTCEKSVPYISCSWFTSRAFLSNVWPSHIY